MGLIHHCFILLYAKICLVRNKKKCIAKEVAETKEKKKKKKKKKEKKRNRQKKRRISDKYKRKSLRHKFLWCFHECGVVII